MFEDDELISAEEVLTMLKKNKVSEGIPPHLREALYVERSIDKNKYEFNTLEKLLINALENGRSLVIAGSAGGGKTMLMQHIRKNIDNDEIVFVEDLTAVEGNRGDFLKKHVVREQYVIAANEGILRSKEVVSALSGIWENLKDMQNGFNPQNMKAPIIVDIAGFDPVINSLKNLLSLEILRKAVFIHEKNCPQNLEGSVCPRLEALNLLNEEMIDFLVFLISNVIASGEVTYRLLWEFISDIYLGGDCNDAFPTSVWFWRIFYGKTKISDMMRDRHRPELLSLGNISGHIFRGDIQRVSYIFENFQYQFVDPGIYPISAPDEIKGSILNWLKIQYALIARAKFRNHPDITFFGEMTANLENYVFRENRLDLLIQSINGYFLRDRNTENRSNLNLYIDFSLEKKEKRPVLLIGLGQMPKNSLSLQRSITVGNLNSNPITGSRLYLHAKNSKNSVLELTSSIFDALSHGRPVSTERRKFDDADYAIRKFFIGIYDSETVTNPESLMLLNAESGEATETTFLISDNFRIEVEA